MTVFRGLLVVAGVSITGLIAGCDAGRGSVSGTLTTSSGLPLVNARITVRNDATGHWATGVTDQQGYFQLGTDAHGNGVEPGDYQVMILEDKGDWDHPAPPMIAAKYARASTSGLALNVLAGEEVIFDVVLDPPRK